MIVITTRRRLWITLERVSSAHSAAVISARSGRRVLECGRDEPEPLLVLLDGSRHLCEVVANFADHNGLLVHLLDVIGLDVNGYVGELRRDD